VDTNDHGCFITISGMDIVEKDAHTGQYVYIMTGTASAILKSGSGIYSRMTDGNVKLRVAGGSD